MRGQEEVIHEATFTSFEEVWSGLLDLWQQHRKEDPDVGVTFRLFNKYGGELEIGVCDEGWLLILCYPDGPQVIFSLREPSGIVAFLTPHYTEFGLSCIHEEEHARRALRRWLDTGGMHLFLVPGRDLGYPYGSS